MRGHADSMALRLACHDTADAPASSRRRARRRAPCSTPSRQARVESIGSRRMEGMADNLDAMLEDRYHRGGKYEDITDRADAPIEDAVALMVRERTEPGASRPRRAAKNRRPLARSTIESKAGRDLDPPLARHDRDTSAASPRVRDLLVPLRHGRCRASSSPKRARTRSWRTARIRGATRPGGRDRGGTPQGEPRRDRDLRNGGLPDRWRQGLRRVVACRTALPQTGRRNVPRGERRGKCPIRQRGSPTEKAGARLSQRRAKTESHARTAGHEQGLCVRSYDRGRPWPDIVATARS